LAGNHPPRRFLSRAAIDQTQNSNLDPKKRAERDRNQHHGQERRAVKEAERKYESWQIRETQFGLSAKAIRMKWMKVIYMIQNRMVLNKEGRKWNAALRISQRQRKVNDYEAKATLETVHIDSTDFTLINRILWHSSLEMAEASLSLASTVVSFVTKCEWK
jgi:hypothetical protein